MARNSSKSANSFMPLYGGDYLRDTMHLSCVEHGIYLRLLIHYWHAQAALPADERKLEGIAGARTCDEQAALKSVVQEFFPKDESDGLLHNSRADLEISRAKAMKEKKSSAGRIGNDVRWSAKASRSGRDRKSSPATATATAIARATPTATTTATGKPSQKQLRTADAARGGPGNGTGKTRETETAYRQSMTERYGSDPGALNAKQRGMLTRFLDRVPADEAPAIAVHYVRSNRGLYVSAGHCLDLLLRDAEGIRLSWKTGSSQTDTAARQADRTQATHDAFAPLLAEAEARERK